MPQPRRDVHLRVYFDELAWEQDLAAASRRAREVAADARARVERDGQPYTGLLSCHPEHQDRTQLPNCVKAYIPPGEGSDAP